MNDLVKRLREAVDALNAAIDDTHPEGDGCDICRAADELDDIIAAIAVQPVGLDVAMLAEAIRLWYVEVSDERPVASWVANKFAALASEPQP